MWILHTGIEKQYIYVCVFIFMRTIFFHPTLYTALLCRHKFIKVKSAKRLQVLDINKRGK